MCASVVRLAPLPVDFNSISNNGQCLGVGTTVVVFDCASQRLTYSKASFTDNGAAKTRRLVVKRMKPSMLG